MKKQVYISVSTDPIEEYQLICEYAKEMQGNADFLHCDIMDGKLMMHNLSKILIKIV